MAIRKKGKKIVNAKKIIIDGITFQSGLEGTMYKLLKEAGIVAGYEVKEYVLMDGFVYGAENWERTPTGSSMTDKRKRLPMRYTPDFVGENEEFIIEVKGRPNEAFPLRWKVFQKAMIDRGNPPMLFMPKSKADCIQVIEILKSKGYGC